MEDELNYGDYVNHIIMVFCVDMEKPFHSKLINHSKYHILLETKNGKKILLNKSWIFFISETYKSSIEHKK
jgi:hypothetical protein